MCLSCLKASVAECYYRESIKFVRPIQSLITIVASEAQNDQIERATLPIENQSARDHGTLCIMHVCVTHYHSHRIA